MCFFPELFGDSVFDLVTWKPPWGWMDQRGNKDRCNKKSAERVAGVFVYFCWTVNGAKLEISKPHWFWLVSWYWSLYYYDTYCIHIYLHGMIIYIHIIYRVLFWCPMGCDLIGDWLKTDLLQSNLRLVFHAQLPGFISFAKPHPGCQSHPDCCNN